MCIGSVGEIVVLDNSQKTNLSKSKATLYAFPKSTPVEYSGTEKYKRGRGPWKATILLRICKFITLAYD